MLYSGLHGRIPFRMAPPVIRRAPGIVYASSTAAGGGAGTIGSPFTISEALKAIDGFDDQIIRLSAPVTNPLRSEVIYNSGFDVVVEGWDREPWYHYGSEVHTSGWASLGGGIYSKTIGASVIGKPLVSTIPQTIGDRSNWWYRLLDSTSGTATPSEGQFGYTGGVCYVRLPDDENPNNHTIEIPRRNTCWQVFGMGRVTLRDAVNRAGFLANTLVGLSTSPDGAGNMTLEDCLSEYGGSAVGGVGAGGKFESLICRRVKAYRNENDGFNIKCPLKGGSSGVADLYDCEGSYNGDITNQSSQGASAHDVSTMNIYGGRYDWNVSGGMVSIETSINNLIGNGADGAVYMEHNMRLGNVGGTITNQAACGWLESTTGAVTGPVFVRNNLGVGVRVATPGAVSGISNIVSTGNGAADIIA